MLDVHQSAPVDIHKQFSIQVRKSGEHVNSAVQKQPLIGIMIPHLRIDCYIM